MMIELGRYNDGVVHIYKVVEVEESFLPQENVGSVDNLERIVKLNYEEASSRERDITFAEQNDFSFSLKIKTRLMKIVNNKCKAVIGNYLYDVVYVDKSSKKKEMWLFLEGIKPFVGGVAR